MRLTTRPITKTKSLARRATEPPASLPKPPIQSTIPSLVWAVFIGSVLLFLGTVYVNSWTSTGPTFVPPEFFQPSELLPKNPFVFQAQPSGRNYLPEFLQVPANVWELIQPPVLALGLCVLLRHIPCNNWTRLVVRGLVIAVAIRYITWRLLGDTINLTTGLSTFFGVWLIGSEILSFIMLVGSSLQGIISTADERSRQADRYQAQIKAGEYLPSVDVLVPTYNEQAFIIQRTIIACQNIDYPNKQVYICDDSRRPQIRELAQKLGCGYITQPDGVVNKHAKAGNLNNAIRQTNGELITIFDADFVPFRHFLLRVVGFFQNPKLALLQTPQEFYNPDHHVRNLGLAHVMPGDLQQFFRHDQSTRDAGGAAVCCGTSFIMRRSALEAVGGFYLRCIPEDSSTSLMMMSQGWEVTYLNETLSMGESPRTYQDFIKQRLRWLQGNIQIFLRTFDDIPLWKNPNWIQQSYFVTMFLGAFTGPLLRATYLIAPILCLYIGVSGYIASFPEIVYYGIPYVVLLMGTSAWASNYHVSHFYSDMYETIMCFPALGRIVHTLKHPFNGTFKVTSKGVTVSQKNYNLRHTWMLVVLILLTVIMLGLQLTGRNMGIWDAMTSEDFGMLFFWMGYNVFGMTIAVLSAIDQPERRTTDRYPLSSICKLTSGDRIYWGYSENASESGACAIFAVDSFLLADDQVQIEFPEHELCLEATVQRVKWRGKHFTVGLHFPDLTLEQHRQLVNLLYIDMSWWKKARRMGGVEAALAYIGSFLSLKPLLSKYH